MAKRQTALLTNLSTAELKRLLAARKRIDVLEKVRAKLARDLAAVERELDKLISGAGAGSTRRKKTTRRKVAGKKKVRKKAAAKKTTRAAAKKTAAKKTAAKKTTPRKTVRRKKAGKKTAGGRVTLEQVVLGVIRKKKAPVAFKDLKKTIVDGKLFKTKSSNFDNVLRRTLSTSKAIKRVGRGIYDAA